MDSDNIFEGLKENKKTLIVALALIVVMIVISILNLVFDNNDEDIDMNGILTSFAEIYYEEYYYLDVKSTFENNYSQKLKEDESEGIILSLREIINTFNNVDSSQFYQEGNYCDDLATHAVIYPKYPYDIDDYKIEVEVSCQKEIYGD